MSHNVNVYEIIIIESTTWQVSFTQIKLFQIKGIWRGGFLGFQETPFDSKAISKITYLNKYTIINILASYTFLSANTIQYLSETFMQTGLLL